MAAAVVDVNAAQEVAGDMVGLLDSALRCMRGVMNSYRYPWALAMTAPAGLGVILSRAAYPYSGSC